MTAREYLKSQLEIDCLGFNTSDPKLQSALCAYAERIDRIKGYSVSDLDCLLEKNLDKDSSKICSDFVSHIAFYLHTHNEIRYPVDD